MARKSAKKTNHDGRFPETPAAGDPPAGPLAHLSGGDEAPARCRPRQERAQETVGAILQAAAELIASGGYARATTNRIASRAGVSIGSLYRYFPDKGAIVGALIEQHATQIEPVILRAIEGLEDPEIPVEQVIGSLFEELVVLHGDRPQLNRLLVEHPRFPDVVVAVHEEALHRRVAAALARRPETRRSDPLAVACVLGQSTEALTRWLVHEAPPWLDRAAYTREAVRMLTGLLVGGAQEEGAAPAD